MLSFLKNQKNNSFAKMLQISKFQEYDKKLEQISN